MFAPLDYLVIGLYFAALVAVGIRAAVSQRRRGSDKNSDSADYFLAGRTLTLPAFVATLVATWYGGILGVGEFAYTSGIATWFVFGLPYYVFAVLYALFLARRVRSASASSADLTIPDILHNAHGSRCALLGATYLFFLVTPAPYVLMLGTLFKSLFGLPLLAALILGTALSVVFVITGGFSTDVRTNIVQFALMFVAFGLLLGFAVARHGGASFLLPRLPVELKQATGGLPPSTIVVWYFIALWTLVDPGFHQRCSAARDVRTARNGILVSVACWAVFDFLTISTGLYARALLPELPAPIDAYPALSHFLLPPGAKGLFWVGMLATVMSTVLSYTFIAGITAGRDVAWRWRRRGMGSATAPEETAHSDIFWTRAGILLTAVLSIVAALILPSVVGLWYVIGTAFVPGLLLPLLSAYVPGLRVPSGWTLAAMLAGTLLPILWILPGARAGGLDTEHYPLHTEPMLVGLAATVVLYALGRLFGGAAQKQAPAETGD